MTARNLAISGFLPVARREKRVGPESVEQWGQSAWKSRSVFFFRFPMHRRGAAALGLPTAYWRDGIVHRRRRATGHVGDARVGGLLTSVWKRCDHR